METNFVQLSGVISEPPVFDHESYGEKFYKAKLDIKRTSENVDSLPVLISENLCDVNSIKNGERMKINGQLRSYNLHEADKVRVVLNVFVVDLEVGGKLDINGIELSGYLCKEPIYRTTPLGREITNLVLAVNRINGKVDYIPLITWGRLAKIAKNYKIGDYIHVKGRIQNREYTKVVDDSTETKIAYEVSVSNINREI